MSLKDLLERAVQRGASDVHCVVGRPPTLRVNGALVSLDEENIFSIRALQDIVADILSESQKKLLAETRELGFTLGEGEGSRFRANIFWEKGAYTLVARLIPSHIPTMEEVALPAVVQSFTSLHQGLVLVTGPTGSGKSTTLASLIEAINETRAVNIITFEDPIEFLFSSKKAIVRQRELGSDVTSLQRSLKYVVRHDPDVIMIGEMRDPETIRATITLAETGHVVFSTLHTSGAAQTINRIIDFFPPGQQTQIRLQLALTLRGIISQQLIPCATLGRYGAREILINTSGVANLIRENKIEQIKTALQTGGADGMTTMDQSLKALVRDGLVSPQEARAHMAYPEELDT